jgi:hypothetical protein
VIFDDHHFGTSMPLGAIHLVSWRITNCLGPKFGKSPSSYVYPIDITALLSNSFPDCRQQGKRR